MFATMSAARVTPRGLGRLNVRAVRVTLQFAALIAFAVTGMVLLSFAIAEPIALPIAQRAGTVPLADIAEASLKQIAEREYVKLVDKFGFPKIGRPSDTDLEHPLTREIWAHYEGRHGDTCEHRDATR